MYQEETAFIMQNLALSEFSGGSYYCNNNVNSGSETKFLFGNLWILAAIKNWIPVLYQYK